MACGCAVFPLSPFYGANIGSGIVAELELCFVCYRLRPLVPFLMFCVTVFDAYVRSFVFVHRVFLRYRNSRQRLPSVR